MSKIISDPEVLGGKPVVEGTRLSVEHILGLFSNGMSQAEVLEAYPALSGGDIREVFRYAAESLKNDVVLSIEPSKGVE